MTQPNPAKAVLQFRPRDADLERSVRELAKDSGLVSFTRHARERLEERGLTDRQALFVLMGGTLVGGVSPGQKPGEWKCKMVARIKGNRDAGVVTLVVESRRLIVLTVEWEDL